MENDIQNNNNDINNNNSDPNNDNNQNKENTDNTKEKNENALKKDKKIKYKMNFSVIIEKLRNDSDKQKDYNEIEFTSNLLLMSSEINQSNKISCLTLISYLNYTKKNTSYIYYLNKKTLKYLQSQKGIESFIYIRTLYRAADLLKDEKNYFYAYKYIREAELLSKNSKIDSKSQGLLNDLKREINNKIVDYKDNCIIKFKDIENPNNLTEEKCNKLKNLIKILMENKYELETSDENAQNQNEYLYLINKKWVEKANNFMKDYMKIKEKTIKSHYFSEAFDINYIYNSYFGNDEKYKKVMKFAPFPCLIDNYNISNWTDYWKDPLNEDENDYIQSNLVYNKDYCLLKKQDFEFLEYFFGVTNIIKRKRNCIDFVTIKSIIFDKRLNKNDLNYLLRRRNIQMRKISTILDFKEKILRCVKDSIDNPLKMIDSKNKNENENSSLKNNKNKNNNKNESIIEEKNTQKEGEKNEAPNNTKDDKFNIHFYLLDKNKKDILIEILLSMTKTNIIQSYDSVYIEKQHIEDSENITKLSSYDKKKYILMIEIQTNDEPLFLKEINIDKNKKYCCAECKNVILSLDNIYKCNICHFSIFCSEKCANSNQIHKSFDDYYRSEYLFEEFDLEKFLKNDLKNFFKKDNLKGMVGLNNLGNTCYMNSALQCLSNTFDLTKYFLLKYYKNDINRGNKLGSNGSIANEYYKLIESLWLGTNAKIAPIDFKNRLQKEKKQFMGYRQQDAQEFLSVLLDQLHEDLNRISNKPYVELLEKQPNENDEIASKRWWDLHKKREDSIIVDLFNGQLKSETICTVCGKSSITYDPFMFLCLPLPKSKSQLEFKIFCGIECIIYKFDYFDKCTILDLSNKVIQHIKENRQGQSNDFDLEIVLLDSNKEIKEIICVDVKDKQYSGQKLLTELLKNKNEIIFYEKMIDNKNKCYNIFIYPITKQKPVIVQNTKLTNLEYLSYPLYFQVEKEKIFNNLCQLLLNRLKDLNFFEKNAYDFCKNNKKYENILQLNYIHGKETKKEGLMSYFYFEETCKYCSEYNNRLFYCPIQGESKTKLSNLFYDFKDPIKLVAISDCYNKNNIREFTESNYLIQKGDSMESQSPESLLLKDCLDLYGKEDDLKDDDMWYCSQCQKLQLSTQKLQIYKSPYYLIIQLKRFNVKKNILCESTFTGEKKDNYIIYPISDFDLSEYIVGPEKNNAKYDLYGVIQHFGGLSGGHYTAICKNDNNWVSYNDSTLDIVTNPVTKNAYILFYIRKDLEQKRNNECKDEKKEINEPQISDGKENK